MKKLVLLYILFFLTGCELINPDEAIPGYVQVNNLSLQTDLATQGSNNAKITDAWLFANGQEVGVFELGKAAPIVPTGIVKLSIQPGIVVNGINGMRTAYPFYNALDTVFNLKPTDEVNFNLNFTYSANATFAQIENFEGNLSLQRVSGTDTIMTISQNAQSLEGFFGHVIMDDVRRNFNYISSFGYLLPITTPSYCELNFMCTEEFTVGINTLSVQGNFNDDIVTLKPTSIWKKVYINLNDIIKTIPNPIAHKIYIKGFKQTTGGISEIMIDNLKVIY